MTHSQWREADRDIFAAAWQAEVAKIPEFATSSFHVVNGLLLPIRRRLPEDSMRVSRLQAILLAEQICHRAPFEPLPMQPPFTAWINQPIAHQGLEDLAPGRALARLGQPGGKELYQPELLIKLRSEPAGAPLPRPMQFHGVEPDLNAVPLGMLGHLPLSGEQGQLCGLLAAFIEGGNDPAPCLSLAVIDLAKV